jgi:hypothetical protein
LAVKCIPYVYIKNDLRLFCKSFVYIWHNLKIFVVWSTGQHIFPWKELFQIHCHVLKTWMGGRLQTQRDVLQKNVLIRPRLFLCVFCEIKLIIHVCHLCAVLSVLASIGKHRMNPLLFVYLRLRNGINRVVFVHVVSNLPSQNVFWMLFCAYCKVNWLPNVFHMYISYFFLIDSFAVKKNWTTAIPLNGSGLWLWIKYKLVLFQNNNSDSLTNVVSSNPAQEMCTRYNIMW